MGTAVTWVSVGLIGLGVLVVLVAVLSISGRVRPLRRSLRRLSWRRDELERLRTRAEGVNGLVQVLAAQAADLADRRPRTGAGQQP